MHSAFRVLLAPPAALLLLTLLLFFLRPGWAQERGPDCSDKASMEVVLLEFHGASGLVEGYDAAGVLWRWYYGPKSGTWILLRELRQPDGSLHLCFGMIGTGARPARQPDYVPPPPAAPKPREVPA